jgi:hypothetical protein
MGRSVTFLFPTLLVSWVIPYEVMKDEMGVTCCTHGIEQELIQKFMGKHEGVNY